MKIKIKTTESKEVEKEIELPYYSKSGNKYYKVISDGDYGITCVYYNPTGGASICNLYYLREALAAEPSDAMEFEGIYHLVKSLL